MENSIAIKDGKVVLKSFIDRKSFREYNSTLYEGITQDLEGHVDVKIPFSNLEKANDVLVMNCIESVEMNGQKIEPDVNFINSIPQEDFIKILLKCNSMIKQKEEKKSESSKK